MIDTTWSTRRVIAFGHRGSARLWPENTLYAFRQAVAAGVPALELDLRATRDAQVVVCHDPTLERTTGCPAAVTDLDLADLRRLDAAYHFRPGHGAEADAPAGLQPLRGVATGDRRPPAGATAADFRIPLLDEVLSSFPETILTMELKQGPPEALSLAADVAALLDAHGRDDDVIVSAFEDGYVEEFRRVAPDVATATSAGETAAFWSSRELPVTDATTRPPVAMQVPVTYKDVEVVSPPFVADAHAGGLAVHVWTINEPPEMHRLLDLGADGLITDRPDLLVPLLQERGVAWLHAPEEV